jgi:hypothetical protein
MSVRDTSVTVPEFLFGVIDTLARGSILNLAAG